VNFKAHTSRGSDGRQCVRIMNDSVDRVGVTTYEGTVLCMEEECLDGRVERR
jgi:hypothetical protein